MDCTAASDHHFVVTLLTDQTYGLTTQNLGPIHACSQVDEHIDPRSHGDPIDSIVGEDNDVLGSIDLDRIVTSAKIHADVGALTNQNTILRRSTKDSDFGTTSANDDVDTRPAGGTEYTAIDSSSPSGLQRDLIAAATIDIDVARASYVHHRTRCGASKDVDILTCNYGDGAWTSRSKNVDVARAGDCRVECRAGRSRSKNIDVGRTRDIDDHWPNDGSTECNGLDDCSLNTAEAHLPASNSVDADVAATRDRNVIIANCRTKNPNVGRAAYGHIQVAACRRCRTKNTYVRGTVDHADRCCASGSRSEDVHI